jgi:Fe-S cluster biogenesis protein NfuA
LVVTRTTPIHSFKVDATWNSLIQASVSSLLETDIAPVLAQDGGGLELLSVEVHATPRMGRPDYQHYRVTIRYQGACGSCASSTSGTLEAIENFLVEMVHDDIVVVSA